MILFPSTLVICQNITQISPFLTSLGHHIIENNPDIFLLSEYKIETVRQIKKFLSHKAYSHSCKIVIIPDAHLLNLESQNTLLKNLEEPGPNNYFILTTTTPGALLPTILSRCQLIKLSQGPKSFVQFSFPATIKESLKLSESLAKDKQNALQFLNNLLTTVSPKDFLHLKKIIKAIQMIKANIDPKSTLDYLFLD